MVVAISVNNSVSTDIFCACNESVIFFFLASEFFFVGFPSAIPSWFAVDFRARLVSEVGKWLMLRRQQMETLELLIQDVSPVIFVKWGLSLSKREFLLPRDFVVDCRCQ